MTDQALNMSLRKFLKQVGVTGQQQIEDAVRQAGPRGSVTVTAVITCPELGLSHTVEGVIETGGTG